MVEYIQELPKEYEAVLRIGLSTDTEDMTGNVLEEVSHVHLDERRSVRFFILLSERSNRFHRCSLLSR